MSTRPSLTEKETKVLTALIDSLYAEPGFSDVDAQDIAGLTGYDIHAVGGILTSLTLKDVLFVEELSPRTGHLGLGENGQGVSIIYLTALGQHFHPRWAEEEGIEHWPLTVYAQAPEGPEFSSMTPLELAAYLEAVGADHEESGADATACDYFAAAVALRMQANEIEKQERIKRTLRELIT